MERYAVSWSDVYAHVNDDFDGLNTARFATLREAVPCAMKHGGIIRNMKESPADGGTMRFYNEPGEWSATGVPWGYARDCFIAAAGDALLALCPAGEEPLSALGYNRYNLNYEDRLRFEHECIRFYCDMLPHLRFPVSYELANRAGSLFIAARCGTGLDFMDEDKLFGGHDKARLFTEMARTYEALVVFPSGWTFSILWNGGGAAMRSIGHHEAMAELVRQHDRERPYAPENGHPLAFAPGDKVTFVNDYGVRFPGHVVVRIMQRDEDEWLYCAGRRYFIDSDSPWFPVCEENLLPE